MFALLAFVAFLIGLIVHVVVDGLELKDTTLWLLLGLTFLAAHHIWERALPWNRGNPG